MNITLPISRSLLDTIYNSTLLALSFVTFSPITVLLIYQNLK